MGIAHKSGYMVGCSVAYQYTWTYTSDMWSNKSQCKCGMRFSVSVKEGFLGISENKS